MFDPYLLRWSLVPDGNPITTPAARLLPVLLRGEPERRVPARSGQLQ